MAEILWEIPRTPGRAPPLTREDPRQNSDEPLGSARDLFSPMNICGLNAE
jgi:hypothetical protein